MLSSTVAEAIKLTKSIEAMETAWFIEKMNKFFDCFNVSSFVAGKKRKPFQQPYRGADDFRLTVRTSTCIIYINFIIIISKILIISSILGN